MSDMPLSEPQPWDFYQQEYFHLGGNHNLLKEELEVWSFVHDQLQPIAEALSSFEIAGFSGDSAESLVSLMRTGYGEHASRILELFGVAYSIASDYGEKVHRIKTRVGESESAAQPHHLTWVNAVREFNRLESERARAVTIEEFHTLSELCAQLAATAQEHSAIVKTHVDVAKDAKKAVIDVAALTASALEQIASLMVRPMQTSWQAELESEDLKVDTAELAHRALRVRNDGWYLASLPAVIYGLPAGAVDDLAGEQVRGASEKLALNLHEGLFAVGQAMETTARRMHQACAEFGSGDHALRGALDGLNPSTNAASWTNTIMGADPHEGPSAAAQKVAHERLTAELMKRGVNALATEVFDTRLSGVLKKTNFVGAVAGSAWSVKEDTAAPRKVMRRIKEKPLANGV